ncbi:MAG: HAD family hydrolase, partial [bacterium]
TSSIRWMMDTVLAHANLAHFFDVTICADDVQREKPAPDPYLLALERLNLPAPAAVIIEDSETGIAAAKAAGVPVIAVRHDFNGLHDFSNANAEVDSLKDTGRIIGFVEKLCLHSTSQSD